MSEASSRGKKKKEVLKTPSTKDEVKDLEKQLSTQALRSIVEEASADTGKPDVLRDVIENGINKPSRVWSWAETNFRDTVAQGALASGWKECCIDRLVEAVERQKRKLSAPSNMDDARFLEARWVQEGPLDEYREAIPNSLEGRLEAVIARHGEFIEQRDAIQPERVTEQVMRAVCDCLGVKHIDGYKARNTKFSSDVVVKKRKIEHGPKASLLGGVVELKSYTRGRKLHGAALVQAMKYLHAGRKNIGRVGAVWVYVHKNSILIDYRMGLGNWDEETIIATGVRQLEFKKGEYDERENWEIFLGFIKGMEEVTTYYTQGGLEDDEDDDDDDDDDDD